MSSLRRLALALLLLALVLHLHIYLSTQALVDTNTLGTAFQSGSDWWYGTITIREDGSVDPPDAPVVREGDVYRLTKNVKSDGDGIIIQRDNIVLDGAGHTIEGSNTTLSKGVRLYNRKNVTLKNLNIRNFHFGIALDRSLNITIINNNIENNWDGVVLLASLNNTITKNNITGNNGDSIGLYVSLNNTVTNNNIRNNGLGILFWEDSSYNTIANNTITGSMEDGINLNDSPHNIITDNVVKGNSGHGIHIFESSYTTIANNTITGNNGDGIRIEYSFNNTITGNMITGNNGVGIKIRSSEYSLIYNNVFVNDVNVVVEVGVNYWSIEKIRGTNIVGGPYLGGNYWSGFSETCPDSDGDMICDQPYVIDKNNIDYYPLAKRDGLEVSPSVNLTISGCIVLVSTEPDVPTIDEEVKFTLLISCENDSVIKEVNLYVDGFLEKKWQGTGTFTFSRKYSAGTHTYHLLIVDQEGREFRVPTVGEQGFNVLITEGVAGPPTLRITPFEIVVEYEGEIFRAFYAENITAPNIPPNPNENRTAFYIWMYTKRNWYVLDSNNQVVEDIDTYIKIARAAETAFVLLVKNPDYLRERARFFSDVRNLGTLATILKKFGKELAELIPIVALGPSTPSSVGVERFGSIVKFTSLVKETGFITDVDWFITFTAYRYLTDAENALLEASKLAEPVYRELMSNPSRPKAHVKYSEMLELYELIKKEGKGFAGLMMLFQLHKGGLESYIKSVIDAIIDSVDPSGLTAVASMIRESAEVRKFFDLMCAWEAEQHIKDDAFELGAKNFAKVAREYAEAIKRGDIGGVVSVREGKMISIETASGVEIKGEIQDRKIILIVDSNMPKGKTIMVDLDSRSLLITKIEEVIVVFDGEKIEMSSSLADVLNPNDDDKPEYFILWGSKGTQVLISIPSFSAHTIEIIYIPSTQKVVEPTTLVIVAVALLALGIILGYVLRRIKR